MNLVLQGDIMFHTKVLGNKNCMSLKLEENEETDCRKENQFKCTWKERINNMEDNEKIKYVIN